MTTTATLIPAAPVAGATVSAPLVYLEAAAPATLAVRRVHRVSPTVVQATLASSYDERWIDQLNDAGSGSIVLDNDDEDLGDFGEGDMIRFDVHGQPAMMILAREFNQTTVAGDEEYGEATTISGPGHMAVLDEAVVYPSRGVEVLPVENDRCFNWAAVPYDDSDWITATSHGAYGDNVVDWLDGETGGYWPFDWPDGGADYIGPNISPIGDAPQGDCYYRKVFTAPGGRVIIYAGADNVGDLWIDGQKVRELGSIDGAESGFAQVDYFVMELSAGDHTLAAHVWNAPDDGDPGNNPTMLILSMFEADITGQPTSTVPIINTDNTWLICEYPPYPPGMTPGEVMIVALEEAQARGSLTAVTPMFTRDVDSDGVPWPETTDIATKVGTDYLTFFAKEMGESYIDLWMAPSGFELYAWVADGRGSTVSVTLHEPTDAGDPLTGNLTALTHRKVI